MASLAGRKIMKREAQKPEEVEAVWHLFSWKYCRKCKKDFVREGGWKKRLNNPNMPEIFVCKACCKTLEDAKSYFDFREQSIKMKKWKKRK